ncbi:MULTISPECIES: MFS transporter [Pseudomonas]|uniref:MFS family arabinose efflux permease n=1 Tax=Pseudomonas putida TaxID=303 RepID=A0A9X8HLG2_PSEPU|nr:MULTISPECIES: MFS transporter [Pseudomonas]PPS63801.1 MFS transporter [Pseudomonas sp. BRM28]PPS64171.1 MFS transporter [Pseudomonas sp. BRM28]PPS64283.1 MFS transporter [Pseudomonas sp. BRM28]ROQ53226.1 putative MFS family arabinose efflux permease [Pseudomonas putida]
MSQSSCPAQAAAGVEAEPAFPLSGLLALSMAGFIAILTETLPAGLLGHIASGLQVSEAMAGQLVTAYALGSLLAAIPLVTLTQGWRRRRVLMLAVLGFGVFNTVTAVSEHYTLTLVARFMCGVAAGLAWGVIAGYARRMVSVSQQGRAMAVAMIGAPLALSLGVPAGTWLGDLLGWRSTFVLVSLATLVLMGWVLLSVPDFDGLPAGRRAAIGQVLATPGVSAVLAVIFTWVLAHNVLYTYIVPFLQAGGMAGSTGPVLLLFGCAALVGIGVVGVLIDRHLRRLVLGSLVGFGVASVLLGLATGAPLLVYFSVALWGLSFGGAGTLLQTASADAAGEGADVAQSMIVTVWNLAIAVAGLVGGVLLSHWGVQSFPWLLLALVGLALTLTLRSHRHGFPLGRRNAG